MSKVKGQRSKVVYLDNAASAPLRPEALETLLSVSRRCFANPSSIHEAGLAARKIVEKARAQLAALAGREASEIAFTSGATEANNLAIRGVLMPRLDAGKPVHAVATALEHASVLNTLRALERRGLELDVVAPGSDGLVRTADVLAAVRPETALVCVMAANNEIGTLQPIREIRKEMDGRALLHVDAVQAVVSSEVDMRALGVDLLTLSAHKIGGPKGVGALAVRRGLKLEPQLTGGGHEGGLRSGTENVAGIAAFGAAAEALARSRQDEISRYAALRRRLLDGLEARGVPAKPLLPRETPAVPHIVALECPGHEADWIVLLMSRAGAMISAGSACKSGARQASSLLSAMGLPADRAKSVIRASFGPATAETDIDDFLERLEDALARRA
jgi:cysteine desulfurase